jgi:hypothetical protein
VDVPEVGFEAMAREVAQRDEGLAVVASMGTVANRAEIAFGGLTV